MLALVAQGVTEIEQVTNGLKVARDQLQMARDIYAGVNEFTHFDPQSFLEDQQRYWAAQVPLAADVQSFVGDLSRNGMNGGHFDISRLDAYRDAYRRLQAQQNLGGADAVSPYDARTALTVSAEAERALASSEARQRLMERPDVETISEGLFAADAARSDPRLLTVYMQRRAAAKEAEYQAFKLYAESMGASPGKAQQLAAMATGLSAQELARIDDKMTQSVAIQQLEHQQASGAKAIERRDSDFLWNDIQRTAGDAFKPPERGDVTWEDF